MGDEKFQVKVITREAIKPSSPTPKHLREVKLSLLDQFAPDMYVPLILFYPFSDYNSAGKSPKLETAAERVNHLKQTLARALTRYYPLAGRIRSNLQLIECNDEGAEFVEADATCPMSEILSEPDLEFLKRFVPVPAESKHDNLGGCILLIQATVFSCGSIAVGLSISHKISDACTLSEFLKTWSDDDRPPPDFHLAARLFPPSPDPSGLSSLELVQLDKTVTKRYVVDGESVSALKKKASSEAHVTNPTRNEVISALIWKCMIEASGSKTGNTNYPRTSIWAQALNLRKRVSPCLRDNVVGNLFGGSSATTIIGHETVSLEVLVGKIRNGLRDVERSYAEGLGDRANHMSPEDYANIMKNDAVDFYNCTSWCRFGFYGSDLGFGYPVWVGKVGSSYKNMVLLTDVRDGQGVEAWLCFKEEDMALFESNQEWLAFASLNPSVV